MAPGAHGHHVTHLQPAGLAGHVHHGVTIRAFVGDHPLAGIAWRDFRRFDGLAQLFQAVAQENPISLAAPGKAALGGGTQEGCQAAQDSPAGGALSQGREAKAGAFLFFLQGLEVGLGPAGYFITAKIEDLGVGGRQAAQQWRGREIFF